VRARLRPQVRAARARALHGTPSAGSEPRRSRGVLVAYLRLPPTSRRLRSRVRARGRGGVAFAALRPAGGGVRTAAPLLGALSQTGNKAAAASRHEGTAARPRAGTTAGPDRHDVDISLSLDAGLVSPSPRGSAPFALAPGRAGGRQPRAASRGGLLAAREGKLRRRRLGSHAANRAMAPGEARDSKEPQGAARARCLTLAASGPR